MGVEGPTDDAVLAGAVAEDALVLSIILAGGIATVLEFVSTVLPDITVALVDCKECESEKVDDLTDDEHRENNGVILTLSMTSVSVSRSADFGSNFARLGSESHSTFMDVESSSPGALGRALGIDFFADTCLGLTTLGSAALESTALESATPPGVVN